MSDSIDQISLIASNSFFAFCFFILLLGSKPGSYFDQDSRLPVVDIKNRNEKGVHIKHFIEENMMVVDACEELDAKNTWVDDRTK